MTTPNSHPTHASDTLRRNRLAKQPHPTGDMDVHDNGLELRGVQTRSYRLSRNHVNCPPGMSDSGLGNFVGGVGVTFAAKGRGLEKITYEHAD